MSSIPHTPTLFVGHDLFFEFLNQSPKKSTFRAEYQKKIHLFEYFNSDEFILGYLFRFLKLKRLPMNSPELYSQSPPSARDKNLFKFYRPV